MNDDRDHDRDNPLATPSARLSTAGARPSVRFERDLADPPPTVWRALTDPEELKAWFPSEIVTGRWEQGAQLTFVFPGNPQFTMTGTVLDLDEPRLLVYTWGEDTLRFELTPTESGGTRLVLIDDPAPGVAARTAAGWQICLERLAGTVPPRDAWRRLFRRYTAAFEPELGPQEGPPAGFEDRA
ncbi:MAG TPA: SRPBCC domain-containing protein [Actinocrinis sp.]|nr:SRPBCC domain-containing protein [Actinocrinis sp.]